MPLLAFFYIEKCAQLLGDAAPPPPHPKDLCIQIFWPYIASNSPLSYDKKLFILFETLYLLWNHFVIIWDFPLSIQPVCTSINKCSSTRGGCLRQQRWNLFNRFSRQHTIEKCSTYRRNDNEKQNDNTPPSQKKKTKQKTNINNKIKKNNKHTTTPLNLAY